MKTIFICLSLLISNAVFAQSLSQTSQKIKIAYDELKSDSSSNRKQLAYLTEFPNNSGTFMAVFMPPDFGELYSDSYKYIEALIGLAKTYPSKVIKKSLNIGKGLKWEADATGQMQQSIVELGNKNIHIFSQQLNSLPTIEAAHLITFLADVENHKAYPEYQQLIESLQRIGENQLATKFIAARALREKSSNH